MLRHARSATATALTLLAPTFAQGHGDVVTKLRFERDIRPILTRACVECHRPGGAAPMPLTSYAEARPWATAIKEQLLAHRMPPWPAVKGFSSFRNAPPLTQRDVDRIVNWVEGGGPRGDEPAARSAEPDTRAAGAGAPQPDPVLASHASPRSLWLAPGRHGEVGTLAGLEAGSWIVALRPPAKTSLQVVLRAPQVAPRILLRTDRARGTAPGPLYFQRPVPVPPGAELAVFASGPEPAAGLEVMLLERASERDAMSWLATRRVPAWGGTSTGFVCPMHPQEQGDTGGVCSLCGMELIAVGREPRDFVLEVVAGRLQPGLPARIAFRIRHPVSGQLARAFVRLHERLLHVFIVSQDLAFFDHVHPEQQPDGTFELVTTLPGPGLYKLFVDLHPEGGLPQLLQDHLVTEGFDPAPGASAPLVADRVLRRRHGRTDVELRIDTSREIAGRSFELVQLLTDAETGRPLSDLEPFLGALAHMVIVSADLEECVHAHPRQAAIEAATTPEGTLISSRVLFPRGGAYRIWTQFRRGAELETVAFTVELQGLE